MKQEVKAVFSLKDEGNKERYEFSVVLGKKSREELWNEISIFVYQKNTRDKLRQSINNYHLKVHDYEFKRYEAPFEIYDFIPYEEVNDHLIDVEYYTDKYDEIIEEGIKNDIPFVDILENIFEIKSNL